MTDPIAAAKKAGAFAQVASQAVDLVADGLATDLRERFGPILPDVDGLVASMAKQNRDDMLAVVCDVVRAILAGYLGAEPNSQQVWLFIDKASAEPAFRARSMRLLAEACRTPASLRRRMLAVALFQPHPDPDVRDEVDAAVEHLHPADVELLRRLDGEQGDGAGCILGALTPPGPSGNNGDIRSLGRSREAYFLRAGKPDHHLCSVASLMRLQTAQCVDLAATGNKLGVGGGTGSGTFWPLRRIDVLPLGRDLLGVLKDERAAADIEESAARGAR